MLGKRMDWWSRVALVGGLSSAAAGCSGGDVSAGEEGDYVNLGRCYAANCDSRAQTLQSDEGEHPHCDGPRATFGAGTPLEPFYSIEAWDTYVADVKVAADGSVWMLAFRSPLLDRSHHAAPFLARYTAEGELVGTTGTIQQSDRADLQVSLGLDAQGNATVSVFEVWAPNADADLIQQLNLYTYGPDLAQQGSITSFQGAADVRLAGDASGDMWLAGNVDNFDAHGILARLTAQAPQWVQTAVPSSGRRAGVGVADLTVTADGQAAVLAKVNPRWNGGPDADTFAVSKFGAAGQLDWALELPTAFAGGQRPALAGLPNGDLVVGGQLASDMTSGLKWPSLLRRVSKAGRLGWGYVIDTFGWVTNIATTSDGRALAVTVDGVAVVSSDGQDCHEIALAEDDPSYTRAIAVSGDYVFVVAADGMTRYELPLE